MASQSIVKYYESLILGTKQRVTKDYKNIAKPIMLLAIFKLIEDGSIIGNRIILDANLIGAYNDLFKNYRPNEITLPIYPYYYLRNDQFYHIKGDTSRRTPSLKYIREKIEFAYFDEELWTILQEGDVRMHFVNKIQSFFLKRDE